MYKPAKRVEAAHEDSVWTVCWTAKSNVLLTGSVDETVKMWQGVDLLPRATLGQHHLGVVSVAAEPTGACTFSLPVWCTWYRLR